MSNIIKTKESSSMLRKSSSKIKDSNSNMFRRASSQMKDFFRMSTVRSDSSGKSKRFKFKPKAGK
jgi:hypothetical protein